MSTNQEISDRGIFLELSVIVMKYSFKLNNGDPLSRGKGAGGCGGHGHPQVRLSTSLGYFNFTLDIP